MRPTTFVENGPLAQQGDDIPVVLIAFRRPDSTRQVLQVLQQVGNKRLYAFVDGPASSTDDKLVLSVVQLIEEQRSSSHVTLVQREKNLGLRTNVVTALDEVFKKEEVAIILEDDCIPSPQFFQFASRAKRLMMSNTRIAVLSGNSFVHEPGRSLAYYSNQAHIWGWMTTKTVWQDFRKTRLGECEGKLSLIDGIRSIFVPEPFYYKLRNFHLASQVSRLDSWAIYFAVWIRTQERLVIHPPQNLVTNVGFDAFATHTSRGAPDLDLRIREMNDWQLPPELTIDSKTMRSHSRHRAKLLFGLLFRGKLPRR